MFTTFSSSFISKAFKIFEENFKYTLRSPDLSASQQIKAHVVIVVLSQDSIESAYIPS